MALPVGLLLGLLLLGLLPALLLGLGLSMGLLSGGPFRKCKIITATGGLESPGRRGRRVGSRTIGSTFRRHIEVCIELQN